MKKIFNRKIHPIIYLWTGQGISTLGSLVYTIGLTWFVIEETGSPLIMGTVLMAMTIPRIFVSVFSGVIGDRISKRNILIVIDIIRFLVTIVWALSLIDRSFTLTEIYIVTVVISILDAVFSPIYSSFIPELIEKDNLTRAASINQMVFKLSMIFAPMIAGIAIINFDFTTFIFFNAFTFLLAGLTVFMISNEHTSNVLRKSRGILIDLKEGIHYFINNKIIFWSVCLIALANIAAVSYNVNLANLIQNELNYSSDIYGIVLTSYSLGAFLSYLGFSFFKVKKNKGYIYIFMLMIAGLLYLCIPLLELPFFLITIFFLIGASLALVSVISTTILFDLPSEEYRGRIFGISSIASFFSQFGYVLWGAIGNIYGSGLAMGFAGIVIVFISLAGLKTSLKTYN